MPPPASSRPEPGVLRHQDDPRRIRLELTGDVDPAATPGLARAIRDVAAERPSVLVLDLRGVSAADSACLAHVLDALRAVRRAGAKVAVMPGATTVRGVLEMNLARRSSGSRAA